MNFSSTSLWRWKKRMKSDFCNSFHKQHERLWSFLLSSTTKTFSSRFSHPFNPRFCEKCFQFSFPLCVFVCVSVWMCGNSSNFERIFFSSSPWIQMIRKSVWRQKILFSRAFRKSFSSSSSCSYVCRWIWVNFMCSHMVWCLPIWFSINFTIFHGNFRQENSIFKEISFYLNFSSFA